MTRADQDVVLQRPEDLNFLVPIFHTTNACAGSATAYILRRIAYRAGSYAPGIQEHMFHELNTSREGGSLDKVHRWFNGHVGALNELGYRLQSRRVAMPTAALLDWVRSGRGYRGAMLPTTFTRLHPKPGAAGPNVVVDGIQHAVGVTMDRLDATSGEDLVMIDPWPGVVDDAKDRTKVSPALESAHKDKGLHALVYFWVGWS